MSGENCRLPSEFASTYFTKVPPSREFRFRDTSSTRATVLFPQARKQEVQLACSALWSVYCSTPNSR